MRAGIDAVGAHEAGKLEGDRLGKARAFRRPEGASRLFVFGGIDGLSVPEPRVPGTAFLASFDEGRQQYRKPAGKFLAPPSRRRTVGLLT